MQRDRLVRHAGDRVANSDHPPAVGRALPDAANITADSDECANGPVFDHLFGNQISGQALTDASRIETGRWPKRHGVGLGINRDLTKADPPSVQPR